MESIATGLVAGSTCMVTKAGVWRYDGLITAVHNDGTYDVLLQDEKITLTHKPASEVRQADLSRSAQSDFEIEQRINAVSSPEHAAAAEVRLGQSRGFCGALLVLTAAICSTAAACFFSAFSLMPAGGQHPAGMCELCAYQRGRGFVCTLWPETNPRCHQGDLNPRTLALT